MSGGECVPFSTSLAVVRSSYLKNTLSVLKNIMQILPFVLLDIANFYVEGDFFPYLFLPAPPVPEKLASP